MSLLIESGSTATEETRPKTTVYYDRVPFVGERKMLPEERKLLNRTKLTLLVMSAILGNLAVAAIFVKISIPPDFRFVIASGLGALALL